MKAKAFKIKIETVSGDLCNFYVTRADGYVLLIKRIMSKEWPGPGWEMLRNGRGYKISEQFMCFRESTFDIIQTQLSL